ncbi:MAG: hypothetical protein ACFFB5_03100 [Promethearchaeota archaeon]
MRKLPSNDEILADTIADLSKTIQMFMQSVIFHLNSLEMRINDISDELGSLKEGRKN